MIFSGGSDGENSAHNAGDLGQDPWVRKIPWRRERLPTPVFLPREFPRQRRLAGYSPWCHKELDTTERPTLSHYNFLSLYFKQTDMAFFQLADSFQLRVKIYDKIIELRYCPNLLYLFTFQFRDHCTQLGCLEILELCC